ncbi:marvel domain-containing protein [Hyaloscypha sp. PMI_1271]|nr:marvel domain-containing protein [Hyaloscypha sp. PMI_1271]
MIITGIFRLAQLLFAAVVIVLSALLINGYGPHNGLGEQRKMSSLISYGAFCGGAGLILAVVGVAAMFFDLLTGIIVLGLDATASFFLLAGGLAFAIQTKAGSCTDLDYLTDHAKLFAADANKFAGKSENDVIQDTQNRCRMVQAETAFVWFLFGAFVVTLALSFMQKTTKHSGNMV